VFLLASLPGVGRHRTRHGGKPRESQRHQRRATGNIADSAFCHRIKEMVHADFSSSDLDRGREEAGKESPDVARFEVRAAGNRRQTLCASVATCREVVDTRLHFTRAKIDGQRRAFLRRWPDLGLLIALVLLLATLLGFSGEGDSEECRQSGCTKGHDRLTARDASRSGSGQSIKGNGIHGAHPPCVIVVAAGHIQTLRCERPGLYSDFRVVHAGKKTIGVTCPEEITALDQPGA
jgi:hypothetical protein